MLKAGTRVGEFEVLSLLGAGGMGEVYRARDLRLQREVALKVLPAETLTDERARARLLREARMAGKLNHPHVCTIHEVGEAEGQVHVAMELVEGRSLVTLLARGKLPPDQALRYGTQVADALAHAHERGVVHRDLKSGNVVITPEGRAKVLDFGLAKPLAVDELSDAATTVGAPLTEPGSPAGTLAYMAPEQLRGLPADERSDIWALGVVLYEMVGGRRPFAEETAPALSAAILKEAPEPLPGNVPSGLRTIIERCLAKERGERYQRAEEVRAALETAQSGGVITLPPPRDSWLHGRGRLQTAAAAVAVISAVVVAMVAMDLGGVRGLLLGGGGDPVIRMAVLPFANLSGDPEQEYFSDGFTQEMITQLARLHPEVLKVIGRTSVMRYKGGDTPVDQIGSELDVAYVLEGSTQREAGRVRVAAELIHVGDQTQIWADTYERDISGILVVQSEVAQKVAGALALQLLPAEQARLANVRRVDPAAYEAYLRGYTHLQKLTPEDIDAAQSYFELARQRDPSYAPAYEGLAFVYAARRQMGITPPGEAGRMASEAALRAITLDDSSAEAHFALAVVKSWIDWNWAGAESNWQQALELNPNNAMVQAYNSHFLAITGRIEEATPFMSRALELDPFNSLFHSLHAGLLNFQGRYEEAITAARTALSLQPDAPIGYEQLGLALRGLGRHEEYLDLRREIARDDPELVAALEQGFREAGFEGAQRSVADLLAARYQNLGEMGAIDIAERYFDAGDHDLALDWFEKAFEDREPNLPYITRPYWGPLHSHPRFLDLLRRMNLPTTPAG